jgi:ABC-type antimicrobial peptide transport system permease subunit
MGNSLKFEFDFDEVFEGIKLGVIKQLEEAEFDNIVANATSQAKEDLKKKIALTYRDEYELKDEIKKEIKDKVFKSLISEVNEKYLNQFESYIDSQLEKNPERLSQITVNIEKKLSNKLYDDLYSNIQCKLNAELKDVVSKLVNSIGGKNLKIKGTDNIITKEEYESLVKRDRMLSALEAGGVDNWSWYGESLREYFDDEDED